MKRISIGGIIVDEALTFIRIYNLPDEPDWSGLILEKFYLHGLNVNFISENRDDRGCANMSVTVKKSSREMFSRTLVAVRELHKNIKIDQVSPVCLLTVYGPHFKERHGLAATAFRAIGTRGINIIGISTSISSISMVLNSEDLDEAREALLEVFEIP